MRRQKGFGIIDVLIAIVCLGVAVPSMLNAWAVSRNALTNARSAPVAASLSLTAADYLMEQSWPPCGSVTAATCPVPAVPSALSGWTLSASSAPWAAPGVAAGQAATLTVTATSPAGKAWTFQFGRTAP